MLIADLDIPAQYLDTRTVHASVDEAPDVDEAVDERHASEEDKVARDHNPTSQQQVEGAEHRHQRRRQTTSRQQKELKKSPDVCGCKGWGGLCRCHHA